MFASPRRRLTWAGCIVVLTGLIGPGSGRLEAADESARQRAGDDWPLVGGNVARTAQANAAVPFLEPLWKVELTAAEELKELGAIVQQAEANLERRRLPVLAAAEPIVVSFEVMNRRKIVAIFRTDLGIDAVDLQTGRLHWRAAMNWTVGRLLLQPVYSQIVTQWLSAYQATQDFRVLLNNSVLGGLSADRTHAYVIDGLAVPQPASGGFGFRPPELPKQMSEALAHNRLQAYDLARGKLKWELGSHQEKDELAKSFFLGAPLPLDGRLYVVNEKDRDIRLLTLDPLQGKVLASLRLRQLDDTQRDQPYRRMHAAHLAYANGMLVCPTNAGAIIGVDLASGKQSWTSVYQTPAPAQPPNPPRRFPAARLPAILSDLWQAGPPLLADGKVIVAPWDCRTIDCLDLRNGTLLWRLNRNDNDLFLGGITDGKVLIVGTRTCRAISLAKGQPVWSVDIGLPAGRGALSKNQYFIPVKSALERPTPEICVIDTATGRVQARVRSLSQPIPGNLVFAQDVLLAQGIHQLAVYPFLQTRLQELNERLGKNPRDPQGLALRGFLRLDQGNVTGAVDDLRAALTEKPPAEELSRIQAWLFEALTDLLRRDFRTGEKYLADYRALTKVPVSAALSDEQKKALRAEQERRQVRALAVIAAGQQVAGRLVEALETYLDLAALKTAEELVSDPNDPNLKLRPDVWASGRIHSLLDQATGEERKKLEEVIRKHWSHIKYKEKRGPER
jgi:hypothetical protein